MNLKKTLFIVALPLLLVTCKEKDVKPMSVVTVSAVAQDDGTVLLTGKILNEGMTAVTRHAFGMSQTPEPDENEIEIKSTDIQSDVFTAIADNLDDTATYYFRALATAGAVTASGSIIKVANVKAKPVVAPCAPALNTVNHGRGDPSLNFVNIGASTSPISWDISTSANGIFYKINFEKKPSTGIYTTVQDFKPEGKGVYILLGDGLSDYPIDPGAKVYVNKIAPNKWDIIVCEAPFVMLLKSKLSFRIQVTD